MSSLSKPAKARVLIGLGNPLMSDEGVGVRLVAEIETRCQIPPNLQVLDMGTAGMGLLHVISEPDKAIFIDCALMGEEPGTMRRFTPAEVVSHKIQSRLSLHEGDLLQTLELARRLGDCPDEIVIFGVEPASVAPGLELSPCLESRLGEYLRLLMKECSG